MCVQIDVQTVWIADDRVALGLAVRLSDPAAVDVLFSEFAAEGLAVKAPWDAFWGQRRPPGVADQSGSIWRSIASASNINRVEVSASGGVVRRCGLVPGTVVPFGVSGRDQRVGRFAADPGLDRTHGRLRAGLYQPSSLLDRRILADLAPESEQLLVSLPTSPGAQDVAHTKTE